MAIEKQVLERAIDYKNDIDGDSNFSEMKFAALYVKFVSLVKNYNGLFDDEQTRRLRWLADYLYSNYKQSFETNLQSLSIPAEKISKILEVLSSKNAKNSDSLKAFLSNNEIKTTKAIGDFSKKLGKGSADLDSAIEKKSKHISDALAPSTSNEKTDVDRLVSNLVDGISKKLGSNKTISSLNSQIGLFRKDFSLFSSNLKREASRIKTNVDKQNKFIDSSSKKISSVGDKSLKNINSLILKSMSIGYVKTVEIPHQAAVFRKKIRPIMKRIAENAVKESKESKERHGVVSSLRRWFSKLFKTSKAKLQNDIYYNFKYFVLDPIKGLAKKVLFIGLLKNALGLGFLKYVRSAVRFSANLVKLSINKVFDLVEGTISFAYNRVLVPIANVAANVLGLATKVFKKHFQNPLIAFLKTYPGAVFLGYATGLIVSGVKRVWHSLFDREDGSDEDKSFFEILRERHPFIDEIATRFEKFSNSVWSKLSPMYKKALSFGNRFANWWTGKNDPHGRSPRDILKGVAVWALSKGVKVWNWLSKQDFVSKMEEVSTNFAKIIDIVAPGYRHTKRMATAAGIASKLLGKGGWLGALLNSASILFLTGSMLFTFMNKPYIFEKNKIQPKKTYYKYFNIDDDNLSASRLSDQQLEKLRENLKDLDKAKQDSIVKYYNEVSAKVIFEASKVDDLITRLESAEDWYDKESVPSELMENFYGNLNVLISEINRSYLISNGEPLVDAERLKKRLDAAKSHEARFKILESLLNLRSSQAKQILNMLTDVSNPEQVQYEVKNLLNVFQTKFKTNIKDAFSEKPTTKKLKEAIEKSPERLTFDALSSAEDSLGLSMSKALVDIKRQRQRDPSLRTSSENFTQHVSPYAKPGTYATVSNLSDEVVEDYKPLGIESRRDIYRLDGENRAAVMNDLVGMMLMTVHSRSMEEFENLVTDLTDKKKVLSPEFGIAFRKEVAEHYEEMSKDYFRTHKDELNASGKKTIADIEKSIMMDAISKSLTALGDRSDEMLEEVQRLAEQRVFHGKASDFESSGNVYGLSNKIFGDLDEWSNRARTNFDLLSKEQRLVLEALDKIITVSDNDPKKNSSNVQRRFDRENSRSVSTSSYRGKR